MIGVFWWLLKMGPVAMAAFIIFGQLMTWKEVVSLSYKVTKEIKLWGFRTLNWYASSTQSTILALTSALGCCKESTKCD